MTSILQSNFFSSVTGPTGPSSLSFGVDGYANVCFEASLNMAQATGVGVKVGLTVPSGAQAYLTSVGVVTGPFSYASAQIQGGTLIPQLYAIGSATGPVCLSGIVQGVVGVTGVCQVVVGQGANGSTGIVGTGSYIMSWQSR